MIALILYFIIGLSWAAIANDIHPTNRVEWVTHLVVWPVAMIGTAFIVTLLPKTKENKHG